MNDFDELDEAFQQARAEITQLKVECNTRAKRLKDKYHEYHRIRTL